jgi:hypothetical protein
LKLPSLRLKKWNATRWLGRATCLTALCNAYPYILNHLHDEMKSSNKELKALATSLYHQLISYDNLVFIYLYRDFAERLKRYSKLLQAQNLQISGVGHIIIMLCMRLETDYSETSLFPGALLGNGHTDNVLTEIFDGDFEIGIVFITSLLLTDLGMKALELDLQSKKKAAQEVNTIGRTTRGINNSLKYSELLSKKIREERLHDHNGEMEPAVFEPEVFSYISVD